MILERATNIVRKANNSVLPVVVALITLVPLARARAEDPASYRLGPDDQVSIRVVDLDKLQLDRDAAPKINVNGDLDLPVIGHLHAEGLTLAELKSAIVAKLGDILNSPSVSVSIVQYRNHPVSVLGAVRNPGVFQAPQDKHLLEVLSLAGGLAPEAGDKIRISRLKRAGSLPLADAKEDRATGYEVGSIDVRGLVNAGDTSLNILLKEGDIVSVSKAELIYVMGAVKRAGGYTLSDHPTMSVLQALSLAEGFDRAASPKNARLLREEKPGQDRADIPVDLKPILAGSAPDIPLRPNDILFVPTSATKLVSVRALEAALQVGTGFAVFH